MTCSAIFRVSFSNVVADEFIALPAPAQELQITGTDRPYGFVSDNRAFKAAAPCVFSTASVGVRTLLLFCPLRFFPLRFYHRCAQYRRQTLFFQYGEFLAISSSDSL